MAEAVTLIVPRHSPGIILSLPWPPTTNNLYAVVGNRKIKSAKGRAYETTVGFLMAKWRDGRWPLVGPYRAQICFYAPTRARYDVDGRCKAILDSIFRAIDQDDSLIDDLRLLRGAVDRENPRAVVEIEEIG